MINSNPVANDSLISTSQSNLHGAVSMYSLATSRRANSETHRLSKLKRLASQMIVVYDNELTHEN